MRFIKLAFFSFGFIFLLLTAIASLIPSRVRISKAIDLPVAKEAVTPLITDTTKWALWHPAYQNNQQQQAAITFNVINDSLIIATMSSPGKNNLINGWQFYPGRDNTITLQWYLDFNLRWYPWEKFGSLFYESTYGRMIEQGLSNIKKNLPAQ